MQKIFSKKTCLLEVGKELSDVGDRQISDMSASDQRQIVKTLAQRTVNVKKLYDDEKCISQLLNTSKIKSLQHGTVQC